MYHQSIGMPPAKAMTLSDEDLWVKQLSGGKRNVCEKSLPVQFPTNLKLEIK